MLNRKNKVRNTVLCVSAQSLRYSYARATYFLSIKSNFHIEVKVGSISEIFPLFTSWLAIKKLTCYVVRASSSQIHEEFKRQAVRNAFWQVVNAAYLCIKKKVLETFHNNFARSPPTTTSKEAIFCPKR